MVTQRVPAQALESGVIDRNIKAMRLTFPTTPGGGSTYPPPGSGQTIINSTNGIGLTIRQGWMAGQSANGDTETQGVINFGGMALVIMTIGNNGLDAAAAGGFWNLFVMQNADGNTYCYGSQSQIPTFPAGTELFAQIGSFIMEMGVITGFDPLAFMITPFRTDVGTGRAHCIYLNRRPIICQDAPNDILPVDGNYHTININTDVDSTNAPHVPTYATNLDIGLIDAVGGAGELGFRPTGSVETFLTLNALGEIRGMLPLQGGIGGISGQIDGVRGAAADNSTFVVFGYTELLGFIPTGGGAPT